MRILSFQKEFKDKLLSGVKISTMRKHKRPMNVGETVQIWCPSPRTGKGKKLFNARILQKERAKIENNILFIEGIPIIRSENLIVAHEGFENSISMFCWFKKQYGICPFEGVRYIFERVVRDEKT